VKVKINHIPVTQEDVDYFIRKLWDAARVPMSFWNDFGAYDRSRYPHRCPRCGNDAYVGMLDFECSRGCHRKGKPR
jgi:hypothetical protein